ncbi:hypothetical protein SAMN06265173_10548 [Thalassovita litoralis]|jgi:hypothetical protein|uniref:Uncharacterized protein n=1 Tax=Thalassovita litoralis TaxID=1010611 RepID=A0A521C3S6_9RHOB|nr:hypothetical protein SAMN06265173_10548 [Thalassovita litoralis]
MQYNDLSPVLSTTHRVQSTPKSFGRPAHGWWIIPFAALGLLAWSWLLIGLWRILT